MNPFVLLVGISLILAIAGLIWGNHVLLGVALILTNAALLAHGMNWIKITPP